MKPPMELPAATTGRRTTCGRARTGRMGQQAWRAGQRRTWTGRGVFARRRAAPSTTSSRCPPRPPSCRPLACSTKSARKSRHRSWRRARRRVGGWRMGGLGLSCRGGCRRDLPPAPQAWQDWHAGWPDTHTHTHTHTPPNQTPLPAAPGHRAALASRRARTRAGWGRTRRSPRPPGLQHCRGSALRRRVEGWVVVGREGGDGRGVNGRTEVASKGLCTRTSRGRAAREHQATSACAGAVPTRERAKAVTEQDGGALRGAGGVWPAGGRRQVICQQCSPPAPVVQCGAVRLLPLPLHRHSLVEGPRLRRRRRSSSLALPPPHRWRAAAAGQQPAQQGQRVEPRRRRLLRLLLQQVRRLCVHAARGHHTQRQRPAMMARQAVCCLLGARGCSPAASGTPPLSAQCSSPGPCT